MIEIGINKISKSFGFDKLFDNISFEIKTRERVALIGDNGCGKSTILNIIAGLESVDNGNVSLRNGSRLGYLRQNTDYIDNNMLVKDVLYSHVKNIISIKVKLEELEKEMLSSNKYLDKIIEKYTNLQEKFINIGGYELDSKIEKVVCGFNIDNTLLDKEFGLLSGGEKTIVNFASIIISEPDILLLDEPTNHLDINSLKWLEDYLVNYNGTLLIVSHDRYFLNRVANKIILLERGNVEIFCGNYDYYKIENENRLLQEFKEYKDQQKLIKSMKNKIKQLEEFGRLASPNGGEMFFRRANSIRKRLEKLELIDRPIIKKGLPICFNSKERSGEEVLCCENINIKFNDKIILDNASLDIFYKDKVCIFGKNGCGKSSLIKDILNNNDNYKYGSNIKFGYMPQEIVFNNDNITVLEEAKKYFNGEEYQLRSALFRFEFYKDNVFKRLNVLSGGERVRLKLFCLMQISVNLLILDEVTNHIDIQTREVLEDVLTNFNGTIIFISHDRYFINKLANKVVYFKDNKLYNFNGNFDDFIKKINI